MAQECLRSYKSVQDYSNSNLHSRNTLFWLKKVVKIGYCGNQSLGLAWDCMEVRQVALFITT